MSISDISPRSGREEGTKHHHEEGHVPKAPLIEDRSPWMFRVLLGLLIAFTGFSLGLVGGWMILEGKINISTHALKETIRHMTSF